MKITVFGATGMVGKMVISQALARGFYVNAFGRNVEDLIDKDHRNDFLSAMKGYVFDESSVFNAIKGSDAVISVLGGAMDGTDKSRSLGMKNIIRQMEKAGLKRIVALGGMGVLQEDANHLLIDNPDYPEEFQMVGQEHLQAYQYLLASSLDWTFVCPPNILNKEATGLYHTSADYAPTPNYFEINAGDLAHCMLQEIIQPKFIHHRMGISRL
jgi:putative NADH-flavin reductase